MKKVLTVLMAIGLTLTAVPAQAADPVAPAHLKMHPQSKYLKYKGMDCWKYWKITRCIPK